MVGGLDVAGLVRLAWVLYKYILPLSSEYFFYIIIILYSIILY